MSEQSDQDRAAAVVAELAKAYFPDAPAPKVRLAQEGTSFHEDGLAHSPTGQILIAPRVVPRAKRLRVVALHELGHLAEARAGVRLPENPVGFWLDEAHGPVFRAILGAIAPREKWIPKHLARY